jgi:DNA polymerase I
MKILFDIESNGLLVTISKVWMLVAIDIQTKQQYIFCDYSSKAQPLHKFSELLDQATELWGHNIIGYDLPALKKMFGWVPKKETVIYDTMIMSMVLNYKRFPSGRHRLEDWGEYLNYPKGNHSDWEKYSDEMLEYCIKDVQLNLMVIGVLKQEMALQKEKNPKFNLLKLSLRNEHKVFDFCARANEHGWLMDVDKAKALLLDMETRLKEIEDEINPLLLPEVKPLDKEPKTPKWIKNGNYDSHTARYFGVDPSNGLSERIVEGPYTRIEFVQPDIGSLESVKKLLDSLGWIPIEWNYKKVGREFVKTTPKLTTESLLPLGPVGEMIDKYYTIRSRHSTLKGWLESLDSNNRLHGDIFAIGTPTGRARHSTLVNVPSGDSMYGHEIRSLFITKPGYKIVGADSAGNQMRGFLHYLENDEFTDLVLNGDVHTENAKNLTKAAKIPVSRKQAKTFLYAYLYGAGADKLSTYIYGKVDSVKGKKVKTEFSKSIPGLYDLNKTLQERYAKSEKKYGKAWIPGLDGRRIYIDSMHKTLNYLLQDCEAITCKAAMVYAMEKLDAEGIPWYPLTWQHDEIQIEVPEEHAERAAVICAEGYREAPKLFNVNIMDGESKIGNNWNETH